MSDTKSSTDPVFLQTLLTSDGKDDQEELQTFLNECSSQQIASCKGKCAKEKKMGNKQVRGCITFCLKLQEAATDDDEE